MIDTCKSVGAGSNIFFKIQCAMAEQNCELSPPIGSETRDKL